MLRIAPLTAGDIAAIVAADGGDWWQRNDAYWRKCLDEQSRGKRSSAVALDDGAVVGYGHLEWEPLYEGFRTAGTPEINDLRVAERFRRRGVATSLILHFGRAAMSAGRRTIGIGVGLSEGYGAAQRLYAKLGFMPDGKGMTHDNVRVFPGDTVRADDSLVLWLVRDLP